MLIACSVPPRMTSNYEKKLIFQIVLEVLTRENTPRLNIFEYLSETLELTLVFRIYFCRQAESFTFLSINVTVSRSNSQSSKKYLK